eukprot:g3835.t1
MTSSSSSAKRPRVDNSAYWDGLSTTYDKDVYSSFDEDQSGTVRAALRTCRDAANCAIDFGCGVGKYSRALSDSFRGVMSVDLSPALVAKAEERAVAAGCTNLAFASGDLTANKSRGGKSRLASFREQVTDVISSTLSSQQQPTPPVFVFGVCANVLLSPDRDVRLKILKTMHDCLAPGAKALFVVPSLESRLFVESLLLQWDAEAAADEGLLAVRMESGTDSRGRSVRRKLKIDDVVGGVLPCGVSATYHYLQLQLEAELGEAGFSVRQGAQGAPAAAAGRKKSKPAAAAAAAATTTTTTRKSGSSHQQSQEDLPLGIHRCEYDWDTEFAEQPPKWMLEEHVTKPFDWVALAQRV